MTREATRTHRSIAVLKLPTTVSGLGGRAQLRPYVETVADASVDEGEAIILGAGMSVRKTPVFPPRVFAATPGDVSGSVKLVTAAAARRAAEGWGGNPDPGPTPGGGAGPRRG